MDYPPPKLAQKTSFWQISFTVRRFLIAILALSKPLQLEELSQKRSNNNQTASLYVLKKQARHT